MLSANKQDHYCFAIYYREYDDYVGSFALNFESAWSIHDEKKHLLSLVTQTNSKNERWKYPKVVGFYFYKIY